MYIGKLNDRMSINFNTKNNFGKSVDAANQGNPFLSERYLVSWKEFSPNYIDIHVTLEHSVMINDVVLTLCEYCYLNAVTLMSDDLGKTFAKHSAETGKTISEKEISLSLDSIESAFVIRLEAELSNIDIASIDLYGAILEKDEASLYPIPVSAEFSNTYFKLSDYNTVFAADDAGKNALPMLLDKLGEIATITVSDNSDAKILLKLDSSVIANGYNLTVDENRIIITASDTRGFIQGIESVYKITKNGEIPQCDIKDAPTCEFRGIHLYLPAPESMSFAKRLVKYLISPMGYNSIIIEICGAMKFNSHPEINAAFLEANRRSLNGEWPMFPHGTVAERQVVEHADIRDFCEFTRMYGIDIIPEIQSLSHVQFLTVAHPEIGEWPSETVNSNDTDERLADIPPNEFYAHCYCPENPKSYEILFDIIDEIIDVFEPKRYVHIGHDEVYRIGVCPKCKDKLPSDLFYEDVMKIYNHIKEKGLDIMMWSDMLQDRTNYKTSDARKKLPRDILMLDFIWYFHLNHDIEDVLLDEGYSVAIGNLYSSHYPRYETRVRKSGMIGGQISTWAPTNEKALANEGKFYDIAFTANMLWSEKYTHHTRYAYDLLINSFFPYMREKIRNTKDITLYEHTEKNLWNNSDCNKQFDTVEISGKYDALIFEHHTLIDLHREVWTPFETIANYVVEYDDGSCEQIPITFGGNIGYMHHRSHYPLAHQYYRHNGYITAWYADGIETRCANGDWSVVYRYVWNNPNFEKTVKSIKYISDFSYPVSTCKIIGILEN